MTLEEWLRADQHHHATVHAMTHDGTIVISVFWGGRDPDTGAPREHAIGGGRTVDEAWWDVWDCCGLPGSERHE